MLLTDMKSDAQCAIVQHLPCKNLGRFASVNKKTRGAMSALLQKCHTVARVFTQSCHLGKLLVERQSLGTRPRLVERKGKYNKIVTARFGSVRCPQTYHVMDAAARMVRIKILIPADSGLDSGQQCDGKLIRGAEFEISIWPEEDGWRGRFTAIGLVSGIYRRSEGTYRSGLMNLLRTFNYNIVPRIQCQWGRRK